MTELDIKIIRNERKIERYECDFRLNEKGMATIGPKLIKVLNIKPGDEVLMGHIGSRIYIAKNTIDADGGYSIRKITRQSDKLAFQNKNLTRTVQPGQYDMGERIMKSKVLWVELMRKV